MNGDKSNNRRTSESGQVLLLLIMVMGTLLIVAMTAIFQSTSETQISGINQLAQKTLAAAEAGLEVGLTSTGSGTFADLGITNLDGIDINTSVVEVLEKREPVYVSPTIKEDQQYTFYLSEYPNLNSPYGGTFTMVYQSPNETHDCTDIALELTFVYDAGNDEEYEVAKKIADAGNNITASDSADIYTSPPIEETIQGSDFHCQTAPISTEDYENIKFLIVTSYFEQTKVAFESSTGNFPPQGKTIKSTARAEGGLTRVAEIFQSYPQLAAEMFTTSF